MRDEHGCPSQLHMCASSSLGVDAERKCVQSEAVQIPSFSTRAVRRFFCINILHSAMNKLGNICLFGLGFRCFVECCCGGWLPSPLGWEVFVGSFAVCRNSLACSYVMFSEQFRWSCWVCSPCFSVWLMCPVVCSAFACFVSGVWNHSEAVSIAHWLSNGSCVIRCVFLSE